MSEKISVKICTGTLCYVMGGAELQLLNEYLPEELADKVDIKGTACLDCCNKEDSQRAPFVQVGGRIISGATLTKVVEAIRAEINGEE